MHFDRNLPQILSKDAILYTEFAASLNLLFNASKTKCMYFNGPRSQAHGIVEFMGTAIDFVDRAELLEVSIC